MNIKAILGLSSVILIAIFSLVMLSGSSLGLAVDFVTPEGSVEWEIHMFVKNIMIWFMLMLVAFLMIFIKKYEWGVLLAVLLSAAGSFVVFLAIQQFVFGEPWNQELMLMGVICAITIVIAIGCFLGSLKMWQYLLVGILFAPVFSFLVWFMGDGISGLMFGLEAADPGGSILVHMGAAYFGLGVAFALRERRAFKEPMFTTTHSVSFVWLAAMLLWVLWPAFVTALLPMDQVFLGMMVCYMGGVGSIISAWLVCTLIQKKVNPLIYTYAMLAGPVAIGAPLILIGPWAALTVGLIAGAAAALSFIYLHPWLCKKLGALDVMGVHNLHGVAGWVGAFASITILAIVYSDMDAALTNLVAAVAVFALALVLGALVGIILKLTRGKYPDEDMFSDDADFIKSEAPQQ